MGLRTRGTLGAQHFTQALCGAVPARRDADSAVPEARARQIVTRATHGNSPDGAEQDVDATGRRHAHRLPPLIRHPDARLIHRHGHQLLAVLFVPGRQQTMADHRRTGTPGLAPLDEQPLAVATHTHLGSRRLGRPHAPGAAQRRQGAVEFGNDRQGIGMAFEQLAQAQVMPGHLGQLAQAGQGLAAARQRQLIKAFFLKGPQGITQGLRVGIAPVALKETVQRHFTPRLRAAVQTAAASER